MKQFRCLDSRGPQSNAANIFGTSGFERNPFRNSTAWQDQDLCKVEGDAVGMSKIQQFYKGDTKLMHKLTFFPLGNADCCLIDLDNGTKLLVDFANMRDPEDEDDLRCDLVSLLKADLEEVERDTYEVVAFTHLDEDHFKGATDFFWLDHAKKYQGSDRIKINTLWVPAAVITETSLEHQEAKILQKEARHRFKEGAGIRVFSRPEKLRDWCKKNRVSFEDRKDLITDAGQLIPDFSLFEDGIEFFVHSPFAKRLNDREVEDRNENSLVFQATFRIGAVDTKVLFLADTTHENLAEIVSITRDTKKRPERLQWDVAKLPHHCSYLSLGPEKGEDKTEPDEDVAWLWGSQGQSGAIIVSTSNPIPKKGSAEDNDNNPPHRPAAQFYRDELDSIDGQFAVTMEHPKKTEPRPLVIEIDDSKATLKKRTITAAVAATTTRAPRAG